MPTHILDSDPADRSDPLEPIVTKGKKPLLCDDSRGPLGANTPRSIPRLQRTELALSARVRPTGGKPSGRIGLGFGSKARCSRGASSATAPQ